MIALLSRLFIKDHENTSDPAVRRAYGYLCGTMGIAFNVLLCVAKLLVGSLTGSIAITADGFNNLSDAGSSIVTLLGFRLASQRPDPVHPFGHGRFEYISGLVVAFLILIMGFNLFTESIRKLVFPEDVEFSYAAVAVLAVSIAVKLYMFLYNRAVGKRIDSAAMIATATDSISDVVATTVVLISTVVGKLTGLRIDAWGGLAVAGFILYSGYSAARDTISPLLGQAPDPELVAKIRETVLAHPEVAGMHDLIIHNYGPGRMMVSLHAEVPAHADLLQMHDVIDLIEQQLRDSCGCDAVVHMDPIVTDDAVTARTFVTLVRIVTGVDERLSLHDFRMVTGPTHTNLIFDVVVPHRFNMTDNELRHVLSERVKAHDKTWNAVINIDRSYL
ncbi:MAG: cation diffusion facilitator family transporter [Eubacteriales bacterium]|jgi:cation diffusion facilitator family transporter